MKPKQYRCPLGAVQRSRMDTDRIKREAWHESGFIVVNQDDPRLDWVEKQLIINIGEKLHGKRSKKSV